MTSLAQMQSICGTVHRHTRKDFPKRVRNGIKLMRLTIMDIKKQTLEERAINPTKRKLVDER